MRVLLCSHDAVDDKVGTTVEDEAKMLEGCQSEHPAGEGGDDDEEGGEDKKKLQDNETIRRRIRLRRSR